LFTFTAFNLERGKQREETQIMDQMGFFAWLIIGAIAGWLASKVMKTNRQQGLVMDIVVGILGAFVGGFLFNQFGATPRRVSISGASLSLLRGQWCCWV